MSIYDELRARVEEGRLTWVAPLPLPGSMLARQLYVSGDIYQLLAGPWSCQELADRSAELEADFDRYVTGQMIPVRMPPSKKVEAYLALLEHAHHIVWEIRIRDPEPQIRVLGYFAAKNCFVALLWRYRWQLVTDKDWDEAMDECKREWRKLFPVYAPPNLGVTIHDYLSKNFYAV